MMELEGEPVARTKSLFQVGIVVRDLQRSMRLYEELLGINDWADMEIPREIFTSLTHKGRPVEHGCFLAAMADVGTMQIELIQPVEGDLPYAEFLEAHGEGLHHIGHVHVPDLDKAVRDFEARGYPCIFAGSTPGTRFAYVDLTNALGVIVELVEVPQEVGSSDH